MKQTILLTFAGIAIFATASLGQSKDDLAQAEKEIAMSNDIYFTSFQKNDPTIFVERYAEDACILAPNAPAMCGRDAAKQFFLDAYANYGLRDGKFITTKVYGLAKDFVVEEGLWQSMDANGKLFDDGKFLVLWKKTNQGWKMYRDSFSSNRQK